MKKIFLIGLLVVIGAVGGTLAARKKEIVQAPPVADNAHFSWVDQHPETWVATISALPVIQSARLENVNSFTTAKVKPHIAVLTTAMGNDQISRQTKDAIAGLLISIARLDLIDIQTGRNKTTLTPAEDVLLLEAFRALHWRYDNFVLVDPGYVIKYIAQARNLYSKKSDADFLIFAGENGWQITPELLQLAIK